MAENIILNLSIPIEDAVLVAELLRQHGLDEAVPFEERDKAYSIHTYINKRILEETGEI